MYLFSCIAFTCIYVCTFIGMREFWMSQNVRVRYKQKENAIKCRGISSKWWNRESLVVWQLCWCCAGITLYLEHVRTRTFYFFHWFFFFFNFFFSENAMMLVYAMCLQLHTYTTIFINNYIHICGRVSERNKLKNNISSSLYLIYKLQTRSELVYECVHIVDCYVACNKCT